jgi:hypothetical protein
MPRIRTLKPECWQDEAFGTVSIEAECLFIGLITQADDYGRLEAGALRARALVWPYKPEIDPVRVEGWLAELEDARLIVRYESEGRSCIALRGWDRNQKVDRPTPSRIPEPPVLASPREDSRSIGLDQGSRIGDQDQGADNDSLRSSSNVQAEQISELFAYWQQQCGHPHATLSSERRRKIAGRLREGKTPQQIREAIDGAAAGAVKVGGKRFDDIELICRNASKLESFIGREGPPVDDGGSAAPRRESASDLLRAIEEAA